MKTVYFQYKYKHFDLFLTEEKAFLQKFNIQLHVNGSSRSQIGFSDPMYI